jgi:DNA invertase Pin-like site-specific DNA recombinase
LVDLHNEEMAFVYQRLSSHEQVKKSIYSIKAQDALEDLAKEDGYPDDLIHIERRDLGTSGTKGREERVGLAHLIELVEAGKVEAVYVVHISRLYRDQTLINALALGELFKEHGVIIVTPQMRLNLRDKMHRRLYRMEAERAADELELMAGRLLGARDIKARSGLYAGEVLPPGYVVNEQEKLSDGSPNPDYHTYQVYESHAQVVRTIFERLVMPGMTPTRVARYCARKGIAFAPLASEWDTPANSKTFINSKRSADGSWSVTVWRVRGIATNPAYIGWKFWAGEIVSKDIYPPIIDEQTFWAVQEKFNNGEGRPKKEHDPLPLAGLLYCGNHDTLRKISYANGKPARYSNYRCYDHSQGARCTNITARILDKPISEAVISCLPAGDLAERTLSKWADKYEAAKEQAASYRREMKRLETEVENLRGNLAMGILPPSELQILGQQIQGRLARIKELADLESQPIGAAIGHPIPGQATIEAVRAFLENLGEKWPTMPNGLKNAVLRLLLDRVIIWNEPATIRVKLVCRYGDERELLIHRAIKGTRERWTDDELEILREHYESAGQDELVEMLPGRSWWAISRKGRYLGLSRTRSNVREGHAYTPEEDELVRRYYAGEIGQDEVMSTGRTITSIKSRAERLKLGRRVRKVTWNWLDDEGGIIQRECSSGTVLPGCHSRASKCQPGA